MVHLDAFANPDFNIKQWINQTLDSPAQVEQTTVVMSTLQHTGEHTSRKVTQLTQHLLTQLPRLLYDLERLTVDCKSTHRQVISVQHQISDHESQDALETLRQLHVVKTRMEQCKAQLKEAENWSQLENEATKALTQQDFEACALRLQQAQQSLDVFQHTPEFDVRRALLETLQHDLETALHPTILRALEDQDTRQCQKLYGVFGRIGRSDGFVEIYLTAKSPALQKGWPGKEINGPFPNLLREFYEKLEERLTAEYVSCAAMFPDPRMVMQALVQRVVSTLEPSLGECLEISMGTAVSSCVGLQGVADSYITTEVFGLALERLLAKPPVSTGALHSRRVSVSHSFSIVPLALRHADPNAWAYSLYEPFLPIQTKYLALERESMTTEIERLFGNVNETSTMSSVQHVLHIILPRIDTLAREGLERCLQLTHGFGAVGWLKVLGHIIDAASHQVQRLIRTLPHPGAISSNGSSSEDNDGSDFQVGLRLLTICYTMHQHYHDFTHDVSRLLDAVRPLIQQSPPVVRRRSSVADRKRAPEYPYASVALLRSSTLNCAELSSISQKPLNYTPSSSLERLTEVSQRFVYDAVCAPIVRPLVDLRAEIEGATEDGLFSRSPSPYMTRVGEQLLMLPQHFEVYADDEALEFQPNTVPFMAGDDSSHEEDVMQRWTTSVARGATHSFVDSLTVLNDLSPEGATQLQTDMAYLINVLAALDIQPLPELALMCDYMGWDEQKIVKSIWAARKDPTKETKVLKKVAEMRGVVVLEL
ncbi:oligomeric Golgi complex subunit 7 [Phycomyces blakesleeanus]